MDLLDKVSTMSIAELRKVLSDNNVKDLSTNKEDLISQVGEVLLTQLTIHSMEFMDTLEDEGLSPEAIVVNGQEAQVRHKYLRDAMEGLSDRERHIFIERRLTEDPVTLEVLGVQYGISRERVRQLENRAFNKVQKAVHVAAFEDKLSTASTI